jgi:hypothetical protein
MVVCLPVYSTSMLYLVTAIKVRSTAED